MNTGEQRVEGQPRLNQAITRCDMHHNTLGYSGTMGNATHVYGNNFYDNSTGIATDSFFAGGHPGYPQDSAVFENNNIYSNNFNSFEKGSDVIPKIPVPVGTGILIAGGNNNSVRGNRMWDNWRRGTMLIAVPDVVSGETGANSTSNRNRYHNNVMGVDPGGAKVPNGVDFWWDHNAGNTDNCWYSNGTFTSDPPPALLPSDCKNTSNGATFAAKSPELGSCAGVLTAGSETRTGQGSNPKFDERACNWFVTPPKPGSSSSGGGGGGSGPLPLPLPLESTRFGQIFSQACDPGTGSSLSCDGFRGQRP